MRALVATTVVLALALAPSADARRAATTSEAAAITKAVKTSSLTRGVPSSRYDVKNIRISTVDSSWSAADVIPKPAFRGQVQQAVVLLRRRNHRWVRSTSAARWAAPARPRRCCATCASTCAAEKFVGLTTTRAAVNGAILSQWRSRPSWSTCMPTTRCTSSRRSTGARRQSAPRGGSRA
jgi:hypothetical protein